VRGRELFDLCAKTGLECAELGYREGCDVDFMGKIFFPNARKVVSYLCMKARREKKNCLYNTWFRHVAVVAAT
jgi:hypothetical protein